MKNLIYSLSLLIFISCSGNRNDKNAEGIESNSEAIQEQSLTGENIIHKSTKNYQEFYDNGALKIEGDNDINGKRSGLWVSYYENGIKWSETYYRKGLKDGHSLTFYPNGQVRFIGEYKEDVKTGDWVFNNEDGQYSFTETY